MTIHDRRASTTESIRRRTGVYRFGDNVRAGRIIAAPRRFGPRPSVGRAWVNGREVGGKDPRYRHLDDSYD
ncbi:MAG: hypothetical protein QOK25_211 [Thermoleophilaceae bacterium]|nr:hypothetical protein [Thermoleophilaceae bacterium]